MSLKYHVRYNYSVVKLRVGASLLNKDFSTEQDARNAIANATMIESQPGEEEEIGDVIRANLKVWGERFVIKYGTIGAVALEDKVGKWTSTNEGFMSAAAAQVGIDKAMVCYENNRPINVEFNRHQLFAEVEYVKL